MELKGYGLFCHVSKRGRLRCGMSWLGIRANIQLQEGIFGTTRGILKAPSVHNYFIYITDRMTSFH